MPKVHMIDAQNWVEIDQYTPSVGSSAQGIHFDGNGVFVGQTGSPTATQLGCSMYGDDLYFTGLISTGMNLGQGEVHSDGRALFVHGANTTGGPGGVGRSTIISKDGDVFDPSITGLAPLATKPNDAGGWDGAYLWAQAFRNIIPANDAFGQLDIVSESAMKTANLAPTRYDGGTFDGMWFYVADGSTIYRLDEDGNVMDSGTFSDDFTGLAWADSYLIAVSD